jgi:hypothetical protein
MSSEAKALCKLIADGYEKAAADGYFIAWDKIPAVNDISNMRAKFDMWAAYGAGTALVKMFEDKDPKLAAVKKFSPASYNRLMSGLHAMFFRRVYDAMP